jgi:hypothetical protein
MRLSPRNITIRFTTGGRLLLKEEAGQNPSSHQRERW